MLHAGLEARITMMHTVRRKKNMEQKRKNMLVWKMFLSNGMIFVFHVIFPIPYDMLGVTFSWALYHYLVNRRCCPAKDLIKPQDSCDVRPRRVWIQWHIAKVSKKLGAVFLHVVIRKPAPDDRSTVTAAVVATVYSVGVLAARIAAGMACPLLVGLLH